MAVPGIFKGLQIPAIASPMFLVSGPDLVIETSRAGVVGTFPALNQRSTAGYGEWLDRIAAGLENAPGAAPWGVNLIVHKSNPRLAADLRVSAERKVPLIITSLGAVKEVVDEVHRWGGLIFHDVVNRRHAEKAAEAGVDGIIAVAAGAGGHAGTMSPFALVSEIRSFFDGTIILGGAISTGAQIAAARMMGADMAYVGTRFIATRESMAAEGHKQMIVSASAADILYTPAISGVAANFLRPSITAAGLDPDHLAPHGELDMQNEAKAWSRIWSAGQGVGAIRDIPGAGALCEYLIAGYRAAMARAAEDHFAGRGA